MTKETKHTPTPWDVDEIADCGVVGRGKQTFGTYISNKDCENVCDLFTRPDGKDGCIEPFNNSEANAHHIVKCVNSHDELVEALELTIQFADKEGFLYGKDEDGNLFYVDTSDCKQALAKAKGQS